MSEIEIDLWKKYTKMLDMDWKMRGERARIEYKELLKKAEKERGEEWRMAQIQKRLVRFTPLPPFPFYIPKYFRTYESFMDWIAEGCPEFIRKVEVKSV